MGADSHVVEKASVVPAFSVNCFFSSFLFTSLKPSLDPIEVLASFSTDFLQSITFLAKILIWLLEAGIARVIFQSKFHSKCSHK